MRALQLLAACLVASGIGGCATARNYEDPAGPIFIGRVQTLPRAPRPLRIVTFNLKFGEQIDRAAAVLSQPGPLRDADVLVLQEMDRPGTEQLSHELQLNYVYVPSAVHPSSRRDIGVAILSPWPMGDVGKVPLPHPHRVHRMRRSAARATVETVSGPVRVYAVHLETPFGASGGARRAQARAVLRDAAAWDGPVVIAGDFNGTGGAREMAKAGFSWLTRGVRNTAWVFDLDHILVRGLCATADPPAARGPHVRGVSDHRPVWAVVTPCGQG
jgi:endonuclease/exonuclease/phosphatase family metal-dependent hydrolase